MGLRRQRGGPAPGAHRLGPRRHHPDQVYVLQGAIGRALFIQFAEGEEMARFYSGDSQAWEVGKHANLVALKPTAQVPDTNLIISTSVDGGAGRVYTFDLALNERAPMYGIRFSYPGERRRALERARDDCRCPPWKREARGG